MNYPFDTYFNLVVGVINTNKADMEEIAEKDPAREGCYTFDVTLGRVVNETNFKQTFKTKVAKAGDTIDITLDLENKKVGCKVNGMDIGIFIENIEDGKYRLLASLYFDKIELELL